MTPCAIKGFCLAYLSPSLPASRELARIKSHARKPRSITSNAGLLAYRELDDALGLSTIAGEMLADARTGKNGRHALAGLFRQSIFGRLPATRM